jgi:hypothetical protein
MEAAYSYETSEQTYYPVQCKNLEDHHLEKGDFSEPSLSLSVNWDILQMFFPMARQPLGGLGRLIFRGFTITLFRHITLSRTPLDEGPARRRDLYLTTHNTHKRQTSMP